MATATSVKEVDAGMTSLIKRYGRTIIFIMVVMAIELALLIARGWHP